MLDRVGTLERGVDPELRRFIDAVIAPALTQRFLRDLQATGEPLFEPHETTRTTTSTST